MRRGPQSVLGAKGKEGARSDCLWAAPFGTSSTARLTHIISLALLTALTLVLCSPCFRWGKEVLEKLDDLPCSHTSEWESLAQD